VLLRLFPLVLELLVLEPPPAAVAAAAATSAEAAASNSYTQPEEMRGAARLASS